MHRVAQQRKTVGVVAADQFDGAVHRRNGEDDRKPLPVRPHYEVRIRPFHDRSRTAGPSSSATTAGNPRNAGILRMSRDLWGQGATLDQTTLLIPQANPPTASVPTLCASRIAASAVPPVASRSSTTSTRDLPVRLS